MDSLWNNPNPDPRIDASDVFKFTDTPAPNDVPPLRCECVSTHRIPVPANIPPWPVTKCETDAEWTTWLSHATNPAFDVGSVDRAFAAVFVPRRPDRPGGNYKSSNHHRVLEYLPFSRASFNAIRTGMMLHYRAMTILLHRGVPVISRIPAQFQNIECQVYILRIQHGIANDHQELVVTHVPDAPPPAAAPRGRKTYAMLLGASDKDMSEYRRILNFFDRDSVSSPFTIIKIFLERERDRRWAEIEAKITAFEKKFFSMDQDKTKTTALKTGIRGFNASSDPQGLVQLYLEISLLKNNLAAWMTQLEGFLKSITDDTPNNKTADFKYMQAFISMLVCEYQSKINKCETMLQGASLAFQMETVNLSRMDTNIALRDGKQMKAVAVLTMIFLPGTFIATLLAVPQLESLKSVGPGALPAWAWYLVLFVPLTIVVLGIYWAWIQFHKPTGLQDLGSNV
ncbi:hypothetical protein V8F06_009646 [Rhypophila decipiens]